MGIIVIYIQIEGGDCVKSVGVSGYSKKSKEELLRAIDECKTLSQLFALIQHEHIVIQMHAQSGASNLTPKNWDQRKLSKTRTHRLTG